MYVAPELVRAVSDERARTARADQLARFAASVRNCCRDGVVRRLAMRLGVAAPRPASC